MTTNTKNVPVSETMTLRELAGAVGVAMGSAYAWSSKGKLPAGTYRDETGKLRIPLTSAEPFIEERRSDKRRFYGYGIEPFPDDVETVDLAWIAAQLNVTQRRVWVLSSEGAPPTLPAASATRSRSPSTMPASSWKSVAPPAADRSPATATPTVPPSAWAGSRMRSVCRAGRCTTSSTSCRCRTPPTTWATSSECLGRTP